MSFKFPFIISLIFVLFTSKLFAQNIDKIGKKGMVKVNGGLNYSSVFYNAQGISNRRLEFQTKSAQISKRF